MLPLFLAIGLIVLGFAHGMYRTRRGGLSVCDVALWFTCIFFGLGYLVSYLYAKDTLPQSLQETATSGFIVVILFVVGLLVGSAILVRRRGPVGARDEGTLSQLIARIGARGPVAVLVGFLAVLTLRFGLAIAFGIVISGDMGTKSFEGLAPWYITAVVFSWSPFLLSAGVFWASYNLVISKGMTRTIAIVILVLSILAAFTAGRREILSTIFVMVLVYATFFRPTVKAAVWSAIVLLFAVLFLMPFFYKLRTARNRFESYDPLSRTIVAAEYVLSGQGDAALEADYKNNMSFRTLFILWPGRILEAQENRNPMYGEIVKLSLVASLPRAWFPWKSLYAWPETAVSQYYSFAGEDYAESWSGYGTADFGLPGAFGFGVGMAMALAVIEKLAFWLSTRSPRAGSWALALAYIAAVSVEATPVQFLADFRNLVLLLIPVMLLFPFLQPKKMKAGSPAHSEPLPGERGAFGMPV